MPRHLQNTWLNQTAWLTPEHRNWLNDHGQTLLEFAINTPAPQGGAYWLNTDAQPDPQQPIFTWISCRMVHVYALAALQGQPGAKEIAQQVLSGLLPGGVLHDAQHGGWRHGIGPETSPEEPKACYDHAFVLLAASSAVRAGLEGADALLTEAIEVFERYFWDEDAGLCRDTWSVDFATLDPYRGINANMHAVEAMLAIAGLQDAPLWLGRALRIAKFATSAAAAQNWRLPEHYDQDWHPDLELNADNPDDQFKPYGATVGHGLEWARLLVNLEAGAVRTGLGEQPWLADSAIAMFDRAVADGWAVDGKPGFVYTTDWAGQPVVRDRMHWVAAEAINTAATLRLRTGDAKYAELYHLWWAHVSELFIDPVHGSWHHQLDPQNQVSESVWPGKPDLYHAYQATLIPQLPLYPALSSALGQPIILVVGEALIDEVRHLDGRVEEHPGGSPANVALTLGRLGRTPTLHTQLGADPAAALVTRWLAASGVEISATSLPDAATPTSPTSRAIATLDESGAASYTFQLAWQVRDPRPIQVDALHIGSISATLQPGARVVRDLAADATALVSYDPNIRPALLSDPGQTRAAVEDLVVLSDIVKASDEDLAWLYPGRDVREVAREWQAAGPAIVVLTLGGDGLVAFGPGWDLEVQADAVPVADTVGAGDTLMGALLDGALTAAAAPDAAAAATSAAAAQRVTASVKQSVRALTAAQWQPILRRAVRAAAITVSRPGANPPRPHDL